MSEQRIEMYHNYISSNIEFVLEKGYTEGDVLVTYTGSTVPDIALECEDPIPQDPDWVVAFNDEGHTFAALKSQFELVLSRTSVTHLNWFAKYAKFIGMWSVFNNLKF